MKHLKSINEGLPFFALAGGSGIDLDSVKIYKDSDFDKFNKEVIQKCGKLKKRFQDGQAVEFFEDMVSNSPIVVIDLDSSHKMILNYNPDSNDYAITIEKCGWGSGW